MDRKEIVKRQFDAQAKSFSNWSVTRNEEYMQAYFEFIGLDRGDTLLDVACGTGEFSVFCARRIKGVHGIDISQGMIELAQKHAHANDLTNLTFECHDVEHIPCADDSFSVNAGRRFTTWRIIHRCSRRCCDAAGPMGGWRYRT
jgi:tRNA/tmRNA/rRNA uracil-C5-methylase (TrmA/RlmC/RlmD family)